MTRPAYLGEHGPESKAYDAPVADGVERDISNLAEAHGKAYSPHQQAYQPEGAFVSRRRGVREMNTENLEALCRKIPESIMKELVELQLTMTAIEDYLTTDPREIPSYADLAANASRITIEAAVELAKRRAEVASKSEKELAQARGNVRKQALNTLFEEIIADPKLGDSWEDDYKSYTVEREWSWPDREAGKLKVQKKWKFGENDGAFPATEEAIRKEFPPARVSRLSIIRRA